MKKSFLAIGALAVVFVMKAQTTYIGNNAQFFVSTDASVYSGGDFMIDSNREKSVENKGNITINGNYTKGANNTNNEGREFVNIYTNNVNYGQVIINSDENATARMTVQRPAPSTNYFDGSYEMSFPYVDSVKYLMHSFGKNESDFKGYCPKNAPCPDRYKMTLTKWDNNRLHHDAVEKEETFLAGDIYNLNLRENDMKQVAKGTISYKGTPSGKAYDREGIKGIITPFASNSSQFSEAKYNDWKVMRNPYLEKYESYLGYTKTASKIYGKNIYRFGNPYTSNIDLSELDKDTQESNTEVQSWLKIDFNGQIDGGDFRPLIEYADPADNSSSYGLKDFTILKRMDDYDDDWTRKKGTITVRSSYHAARINDAGAWEGAAEALIIRPTETFQLYFPAISLANAFDNDRILAVNVNFEDRHKTFSHSPEATVTAKTNADLNIPGLKTNSVSALRTASAGKIRKEVPNFHQLKISLVQDNQQLGNPVFLVGADYKKEEGQASGNSNAVFLYGVKDNEIEYKSKKEFNGFNSLSYVGKPLGVGFNHLTKGQTYRLLFGLYEGNIFNQVDKTSEFFLKDTKTNEVTQIDPKKDYTFVADEDVEKRFVIYWKALPESKVLSTANVERATQTTLIYEEAGKSKIRFENISNLANVSVYNASGRLVNTTNNVSTNIDYVLDVNITGVYMVKVTYRNGEVRTLKFVNK